MLDQTNRQSENIKNICIHLYMDFPGGTSGKILSCQCGRHDTQVRSLGWEDLLKKGMATHSRIHAWRISRTEEGRQEFDTAQ